MPEPLTLGSLFAGGGLMDLGLERAGLQCRWQVEIDDYARRVLAKHWPDVPRWRDVRTFLPDTASERRGSWGPGRIAARRERRSDSTWVSRWRVDVIAAGFPCQDISYAGGGAGLVGKRSGLWFEAARVIRTLRPRYVLLENVAALLTRGLDSVLGTLDSLGYVGESHCLPAAYVGAPHIRDRVFILGYAAGGREDAFAEAGPSRPAISEPGCEPCAVADPERGEGVERRDAAMLGGWPSEAEQAGVGRGVSNLADADRPRQRQPGGALAEVGGWAGYGCTPGRLAEFRRRVGVHWAVDPADDPESGVGRMAHGRAHRMDRLRILGNGVVPQVAQFWGERLMEFHRSLEAPDA